MASLTCRKQMVLGEPSTEQIWIKGAKKGFYLILSFSNWIVFDGIGWNWMELVVNRWIGWDWINWLDWIGRVIVSSQSNQVQLLQPRYLISNPTTRIPNSSVCLSVTQKVSRFSGWYWVAEKIFQCQSGAAKF